MNDMRFNAPMQPVPPRINEEETSPKKHFLGKQILLFVFIILLMLFLPFIASNMKEKFFTEEIKVREGESGYYAVFLDNSQVYFGKMLSKLNGEIVLEDVYYLQGPIGESAVPDSQRFTLIKLGAELHGPTNEMIVNMDHVVFYEKLRSDSKVVESIKNTANEI